MSSKRDLVEAHSFNRRRLITAFVSGAPGGREVEPVRYGRTLVGGLVLAVLIVVGAAVSGFIAPTTATDWKDGKLVIAKESGSSFVSYKNVLYPVTNTTSARLILSTDGTLGVEYVPDEDIATVEQGPPVGITGAPAILPAAGALVQTGWTSCVNRLGGITTALGGAPAAEVQPNAAFLAVSRRQTWVVTNGLRYSLPAANKASVLRALGLDGEPARPVPGRWLDLVAPGAPLVPFTVQGAGGRIDTGVRGLTTVGTPLLVDGEPYVLGRGGRLVELSDFAFAVYSSAGRGAARPVEVSRTDVTSLPLPSAEGTASPPSWPEDAVAALNRPDDPCLILTTEPKAVATVALGNLIDQPTEPQTATSTAEVVPGAGALVRATSGGVLDVGRLFLVDATGTRYALAQGVGGDARTALGYAKVTPRPVPKPWTELFTDGPSLSRGAAGQEASGQGASS